MRLALPGTRRSRTPDETLELVEPFVGSAGITRVAVVSGLDNLSVPVVMVTRPLSASISVLQGKGVTLACAKVSGMMEAFEHFHAETIRGTMRLAAADEISPDESCGSLEFCGKLPHFTSQLRCMWQAGEGILSHSLRWVPFDMVHLDLRVRQRSTAPTFLPSSNGLASGNSVAEATAHALYEVLERHMMEMFYEMPMAIQDERRLVLSSITDATCRELVHTLMLSGVEVTVWDVAWCADIACFCCEIVDCDNSMRNPPMARGFGCHTAAGVALSRAICEAVQSRVTMISGARDDINGFDYQSLLGRTEEFRALSRGRSKVPARRLFRQIRTREFDCFESECDWLARHVVSKGFPEPVVVDLSKPGWPIHVVRVVAPGLRYERSTATQGIW